MLCARSLRAIAPKPCVSQIILRNHGLSLHPKAAMSETSSATVAINPDHAVLLDAVRRGREIAAPRLRPASQFAQRPLPACLTGLHVEELQYHSDDHPTQGWVPLRLVSQRSTPTNEPAASGRRRLPCVIFLHCTGSDKDSLAQKQAQYARRGYLTAAIDTRYHGNRVDPSLPYQRSLVRAWRGGEERPFLLDVVWDVQRLLDALETRGDVDPARIGLAGESLGGMIAWLAAAADARIAAAAPICGVQSFEYAVRNEAYHDRVGSIPEVFAAAAADLGKREVDAEVVRAVWDRILPGVLPRIAENGEGTAAAGGCYDAKYSLPLVAPRPLLVLMGGVDGKTPVEGVEEGMTAAAVAYQLLGAGDKLRLFAQKGVGHEFTPEMWREVDAFMDAALQPERR